MKKSKYLKKCVRKIDEAGLYFTNWLMFNPNFEITFENIKKWTEELAFDCLLNASQYKPDDVNFILFSGNPYHKELIKTMLGIDKYREYMLYLMRLVLDEVFSDYIINDIVSEGAIYNG